MKNLDVAVLLYQVADLLDLDASSSQRARAYRKAADSVATCSEEITALLGRDHLQQIPGVGKGLEQHLVNLLATGRFAYLEELRAAHPAGVVALLDLPGLPVRTAISLHSRFGINDLETLARAFRERRLDDLPGMSPQKQATLLAGIERLRKTRA